LMAEAHCLQHPRQNDQHVVNLKMQTGEIFRTSLTNNDYLVSFLCIKLLGFEIKETTNNKTGSLSLRYQSGVTKKFS